MNERGREEAKYRGGMGQNGRREDLKNKGMTERRKKGSKNRKGLNGGKSKGNIKGGGKKKEITLRRVRAVELQFHVLKRSVPP